MARF
jgi:mitogen-activated protein kinase 15